MAKQRLRNLFYGWRNVSRYLKFHHNKAELLHENVDNYSKTIAVKKWARRTKATKLARLRISRLKAKMAR
eukprot:CAMPEP_0202979938 /NCGR_PEP_ID=MMETSP1396-20130829/85954_1 /ASSEMBLY_ACC=CAM_ASM_000872 /TAXON_ID= /ORGANISM="Pseudokeronopsis sp., Strain Brazil" /LENGTH=69 /DNA_ID=CAMNT_0049719595 /DNA_START=816 /DNA_END=1021 /DNA_ORIENTATION=+